MKQNKLLQELYKAILEGDRERELELRKEEFRKVFKRKHKGKSFDPKWTIVR